VYLPGPNPNSGVPIHWLDHTGAVTPLRVPPTNWTQLALAPDGGRLALTIAHLPHSDIWVYEVARELLTRLTADQGIVTKPVWTPDGRRIAFASTRGDNATPNLYWQRADGVGNAQRLTESPHSQGPGSWHPSGKFLAFSELNPQTGWDVMIVPVEGDEASGWRPGKPTAFVNSAFAEYHPMFSPDGRWMAYALTESGRTEVYVRPFPGPGGQWLISSGGGTFPIWSRVKRELFYSNLDRQIMVAGYTIKGDVFDAEKPRLWSGTPYASRGGLWPFDLHPDGDRFALTAATGVARRDHVTMIFTVFDELRRIAPVLNSVREKQVGVGRADR
jgi:serine/threonine-protein kinase